MLKELKKKVILHLTYRTEGDGIGMRKFYIHLKVEKCCRQQFHCLERLTWVVKQQKWTKIGTERKHLKKSRMSFKHALRTNVYFYF